ncbi:MAG: hypothetical protein DRG50_07215 [Deltaproteobacteria bacterium]|nr:MAG: hypothetical protein DRG50_07215 [Deltaproteobacteria bacterium]
MEVGDKITLSFGKGEKEGIVYKIFPKTVYLKVDFPKHKGKIIKRSIAELQAKGAKKQKASKKRRGKEQAEQKRPT